MEHLIYVFCNKLIQNHVISENDREVYEYSLAILLTSALYYAGCIMIMHYYQCYLLPIIFLVTYMLLRSYIGGWHARNMWTCMFASLLLFAVMVNIFIYPDITTQGKLLFSGFSVLFNGWALQHFGMQDHPNRKLTQDEQRIAKRKAFVLLFIILLLMMCSAFASRFDIMFSMALASFAATILLLLAKFQSKGIDVYET